MKTYDTKIAELNKELTQQESYKEQYPEILKFKIEPDITKIQGKIEQLNELRKEAISEVKELLIPIIGLKEEVEEEITRRKEVIDYLKAEWNI